MEITDIIGPATGAGSFTETVQASVTDAGPYFLAGIGVLLTVGLGVTLVKWLKKHTLAVFRG